MKALSVRQPYALLLVAGLKTIEVRSWQTEYRGDLLIVASAAPKNLFWSDPDDEGKKWLMPAGCHLGVVELLDCRPMVKGDEETALVNISKGAYSWVVKPKHSCVPNKCRGQLQLYTVPDDAFEIIDPAAGKWVFDYPAPQGDLTWRKGMPAMGV